VADMGNDVTLVVTGRIRGGASDNVMTTLRREFEKLEAAKRDEAGVSPAMTATTARKANKELSGKRAAQAERDKIERDSREASRIQQHGRTMERAIKSDKDDHVLMNLELYAETIRYALTSDNNADINFFFERIKKINENNTIPVIWKDGSGHLNSINIPIPEDLTTEKKQEILQQKLLEITAENNKPIEMDMGFQKEYIYYGNSQLLKLLRYYPLSQLLVVLIVAFLGYIFLSYSRRAEQNRVWVGLAKETAHQLGTPLSSLTAWVELLRNEPHINPDIVVELSKDIQRLETITTRFSNIGSTPVLKLEDIESVIQAFISYLKIRISSKVTIEIHSSLAANQLANINKYLFEWVIENICKTEIHDRHAGPKYLQRVYFFW
jgi:hypothetical protein